MSVEAVAWALRVPIGGNAKVVLIGVANHAHTDGTEAYPSLDTLAEYAACDRSTARRNVRKLLADGWLVDDGLGPRGQAKYRLPMDRVGPSSRGGKMPPSQNATGGTGASKGGGTAMPPEPSIEEPSNDTKAARAQAREQVPDDFPDELRPHARAVYRVLRSVAEAHAARAVTPQALGHVMAAPQRRHKPFIRSAHDFASWASGRPRPIRDVVASYRTWIDRECDLATIEPLQAPTPGSTTPAGVTPLRQTAAERRRDLQAERMARAEAARAAASNLPALGA